MESRPTIQFTERLINVVDLCIEIQNKEIGTVFIDFSGHINKTDIRIYVPYWIQNADADYKFELCHDNDEYYSEKNLQVVNKLQDILSNGKLSEENEKQVAGNKEKEIRMRQYEELKKEFEPSVNN